MTREQINSIILKHTARAGEAIATAYKGKIKAESAKLLIIDHVREAVNEALREPAQAVTLPEFKSAKEIVSDANELARQFYALMGYQVEEGYRFDKAHHPQEEGMWNLAAIAYEHIEGTELDQCLQEEDEEDEAAPVPAPPAPKGVEG